MSATLILWLAVLTVVCVVLLIHAYVLVRACGAMVGDLHRMRAALAALAAVNEGLIARVQQRTGEMK